MLDKIEKIYEEFSKVLNAVIDSYQIQYKFKYTKKKKLG